MIYETTRPDNSFIAIVLFSQSRGPQRSMLGTNFSRILIVTRGLSLLNWCGILESGSYGNQRSSGCKDALLGKVYLSLDRMSKASDYFSEAAKKLPELAEYFLLAKAHAEFKQQNYNQSLNIANALLDYSGKLSPQFAIKVRENSGRHCGERKR